MAGNHDDRLRAVASNPATLGHLANNLKAATLAHLFGLVGVDHTRRRYCQGDPGPFWRACAWYMMHCVRLSLDGEGKVHEDTLARGVGGVAGVPGVPRYN